MPKPVEEVLASGLGCQITDTIFNPLEMLKTRIQLQNIAEREPLPQAVRTVWRRGGLWLLWTPGLQATWVRAYFVTGLRVGLYPTVRGLLGSTGENSGVLGKAAAGMATGALSASLAYYDGYRTEVLVSAQCVQAQRDSFGAHGFMRLDRDGAFTADWGAPSEAA